MSKTVCSFCGTPLGEARITVHSADPKVPVTGVFCLPKIGDAFGCYGKMLGRETASLASGDRPSESDTSRKLITDLETLEAIR